MKSLHTSLLVAVATALALSACATDQYGHSRPLTDAQRGAIIGAATGALVGGLVSKHKGKGALIGAIGGGLAGTAVGAYMDKQKQDLEKVLAPERNAGEIQVQKLNGNILRVTMTGETAFDTNSARIKRGFFTAMNKVASVVNRYGKTFLTIVGHTDNVGSARYNQKLSERRAQAVAQYFYAKGVIHQRIAAEGKGETAPRASNATPAGRRLNRRVEVYIEPVVAQS